MNKLIMHRRKISIVTDRGLLGIPLYKTTLYADVNRDGKLERIKVKVKGLFRKPIYGFLIIPDRPDFIGTSIVIGNLTQLWSTITVKLEESLTRSRTFVMSGSYGNVRIKREQIHIKKE